MSKKLNFIIDIKDNFSGAFNKINKLTGRTQKKLNLLPKSIKDLEHELVSLKEKQANAFTVKGIKFYQKEIKRTEQHLNKLNAAKGASGLFANIKKSVGSLGVAAAGMIGGFRAIEGIAGIAKLGMDMEQTDVAFSTMLGSMDKAKNMITGLDKFANATPFENDVLYENSKLLLNFGMAGERVIPTLKMIGDISGGNKQKLNSLALAYAQVQSAGKLTGQDLLQMINAGFNPLNEIAKKTGKSMAELKEDMSKGAISANDVEAAFKSTTSQGGRFYKMMEKQSKTAAGKLSTFIGKLKQLGTTIGKAILPAVNWLVDAGLKLIDNIGKLISWYKKYSEIINVVAGGILTIITAYKSYMIAVNAVKFATVAWTAAQTVLNAVMTLNPIGLIIAGVAALIAAIAYVIMKTDGWAKQWQRFKMMFVSVLDMIGASFKSMWLKSANEFTSFIDKLTYGWYKAKNLMGLISDKELSKEKARIDKEKRLRLGAIAENTKQFNAAKKTLKENAKWELKWNSGKNNSFAKAKDKVMSNFGFGKSGNTSSLPLSGSNNSGISSISEGITSGGKKQTNINIKLEKLQDAINIYAQDVKDGADEMASIVEQQLLRILNSANLMAT